MIKGKLFLGAILLFFVMFSCKEDEFNKYERPEWLDGKLYTLIEGEDNLQTFAECIKLIGYDTIINVSGSYTVFAPTDDAFETYFSNHPTYKSVSDIPLEYLDKLVKYHIVQNPWDKKQLRWLDVNGWIDPEDEFNDKPRGYKRQTLLENKSQKYGITAIPELKTNYRAVDTTKSNWHRRAIIDSRKYAPLFYQEYFALNDLQLSDFSFYFDRDFDNPDDMFYIDAKIIGDENGEQIFAENGFVHVIDKVVEPLHNAEEILRDKNSGQDYSTFLNWINYFTEFRYNESETFDQPGAELGYQVDSLFDLTYPQLVFNINAEKTKAPAGGAGFPEEVSIRFHHGIIAPTNDALTEFENTYLKGAGQWGSFVEAPYKIKKIIVNTYLAQNAMYASDIQKGFFNGENDIIRIDQSDIVHKEYGSNSTFIGVDKAIVPRAFSSITGPVYRQTGYSTIMNAIEYSGLLASMKRENQDYLFFAIDDQTLRQDSSLIYSSRIVNNTLREFFNAITLAPSPMSYSLDANNLRILLMNQVAVESPNRNATKEYLKTLAGNYIEWNNETGMVQGMQPSVIGYRGNQQIDLIPVKISNNTDNGTTFRVDSWFKFTAKNIYSSISENFPDFNALILKAGLASSFQQTYTFAPSDQLFTVFAPSKEALDAVQADTLEGADLENFIKLHFIKGELIFTDGKVPSGYYETVALLPSVDGLPQTAAKVYVDTGIDQIKIGAKSGGIYTTVNLSDKTNLISNKNLNPSGVTTAITNVMSTAVIHQTDKAFMLDEMDVK